MLWREKLDDAEWLSELNERLEVLAEMYDMSHKSIMRFHYYKPTLVSEQFQKFARRSHSLSGREGDLLGRTGNIYHAG